MRSGLLGAISMCSLVAWAWAAEPATMPITFPHIEREPPAWHPPMKRLDALPRHTDARQPFQVDLRWCDVSGLDLRDAATDLEWASFDVSTRWPAADKLPKDFDPVRVIELGKNPGLGVRKLHARGITGRGIGVAIIDAPLPVHHVEYADRLRLYEEIVPEEFRRFGRNEPASMHGAATASAAVGKTVGVAPQAQLYHIATSPFELVNGQRQRTFVYFAQSIRRILEINQSLPADRKIRVISLSIGWAKDSAGYTEVTAAVEEAKKRNVFVTSSSLEETHGFRIQGIDRNPMGDPDHFSIYRPGKFWADEMRTADPDAMAKFMKDRLLIPMDHRTLAGPGSNEDYAHYASGGWSWCTPYVAGVYALACQVDGAMTPQRFWDAALKSGRMMEIEVDGTRRSVGLMIDPVGIVDALMSTTKP